MNNKISFNKQELIALASQSSQSFDREGVLVVKEKLDHFFRRSEGCTVRWFRLRGNLLFYLKGSEPWYEPLGVIVLGNHKISLQPQDENGQWPFQIVWDNGLCYKMATFHESERILWVKAIELAPYENIRGEAASLKGRLNEMRHNIDIASYRSSKGIFTDMNELPLCELALSCDNLLCNVHGMPPSPRMVVFVTTEDGACVRYGDTEIVEACSNPCFSKTILFRESDGLTGSATVRLVVYDVKELVSDTTVPMGYTSMLLSTIQETQRMRVPLLTRDKRTAGFVTISGWSLEPSYVGTSPSHSNDKNSVDISQWVACHRRSQSLPPRLGLKLKFPSYGNLFKQNFVNSNQVTYRFHSGLGGDITVHEIMAEPKLSYYMPMELLNIYIERERELMSGLLLLGETCPQLQSRQLDLVSTHVSLLKHYGNSQKCIMQMENFFKASSRKDDASLEFVPVNLHLQRMWVHNDTLNKTGFHDVITVGAFTAHTHRAEHTGGLIRLVQHVKDVDTTKAELSSITNKIQAEYDNLVGVRILREEVSQQMDLIVKMANANANPSMRNALQDIKDKVKSLLAQYQPSVIEQSLAAIGWPCKSADENVESQTMATILRLTEQLSIFDTTYDCDAFASSSSSSKETSPTGETPGLSSSVPNIAHNSKITKQEPDLQFDNDYFCTFRPRGELNNSFRSVRLPKSKFEGSLSFDGAQRGGNLRSDFKSTASLEQVAYRSLIEGQYAATKSRGSFVSPANPKSPIVELPDQATRDNHLKYLKNTSTSIIDAVESLEREVTRIAEAETVAQEDLDLVKIYMDGVKTSIDEATKWMGLAHAALRLRYESPQWAKEQAALQTRRDTCFSQALTAVTAGLLCWLCSVPADVVVKLLSSELGVLCGFEGLLSLYSTEKAMWGDMVVAVEDLQTVTFTLTKIGHSDSPIPQVTGTRGALEVKLPVSDTLYAKISSKAHLSFNITAVFFNIGVNDKATLAEALNETKPQYQSNSDNLDRLNKYYLKYSKIFPTEHMAAARASSRTKPLEEVMENLRIAVQRKQLKNVEVLHLAALATRLMNGIRFTSCKSAKDRTGMSVTLEQCSILASEYHLAEHEMTKALNIMRSDGCRRENTLKNIGTKKYAFTKKQVMALPVDYRPPPGTYGSQES